MLRRELDRQDKQDLHQSTIDTFSRSKHDLFSKEFSL